MEDSDNCLNTVVGLKETLENKDISAVEVVEDTFERIDAWEPHIHAFLELLEEQVLSRAKEIDSLRAKKGTVGDLAGIPIAVKGNICSTEGHTTVASKILEQFTSPFDATVVSRLKEEDMIVVGKVNLDEFAMGASTEYSAVHVTENPWDVSRVSGGSSGGSAAAVASGEVPVALGTDTGGSVRHPASFCGVVGLKPTYGRASRFGLIAYGSSLDQPGVLTRTVRDAALVFEYMAGQDDSDATTSPELVGDYVRACDERIEGLTIGLPREFFDDRVDSGVRKLVTDAIKVLEELGAKVREVSLPLTDAGIAVYYLIAKAEASSNLARYDGLRYAPVDVKAKDLIDRYMKTRSNGFGPEVKRSILMGTYALSAGYYDAWYKQASKVRTLIRKDFEKVFEEVDVIIGPTTPETAFEIDTKSQDPLQMYLADVMTVPMSIAGIPALSVPCGFVDNLPVGMQITAPHFREGLVFRVGHAYQQATDWHEAVPRVPKLKSQKPKVKT